MPAKLILFSPPHSFGIIIYIRLLFPDDSLESLSQTVGKNVSGCHGLDYKIGILIRFPFRFHGGIAVSLRKNIDICARNSGENMIFIRRMTFSKWTSTIE